MKNLKSWTLLVVLLSLTSASSHAAVESLECAGKDLSIGISRPMGERYARNQLTLKCGQSQELIATVSYYSSRDDDSYSSLSNDIRDVTYKLVRLINGGADHASTALEDSLTKQYLALLVTAKTSGLSVVVSYETESPGDSTTPRNPKTWIKSVTLK